MAVFRTTPGSISGRSAGSAGGQPIDVVWTRQGGLALAVVEPGAVRARLPLQVDAQAVRMRMDVAPDPALGDTGTLPVVLPRSMILATRGDYFGALRVLSDVVGLLGGVSFSHDDAPDGAYGPLWKTWGIGRGGDGFRPGDVTDRLAELEELGFRTVLLDYGWFESEGDWTPDGRFGDDPEQGLRTTLREIHEHGMLAGLWYQPVQVSPDAGWDDWVVRGPDGDPYVDDDDLWLLDPALAEVQQYVQETVEEMTGWGAVYLYLDSQEAQLAIPPDFGHDLPGGPFDATRALAGPYRLVREVAPPETVIESCPDGRDHTLYQMPWYDVNNTGDSASDLQARLEVKELKALRGSRSPVGVYASVYEDNPLSGELEPAVGTGAVLMSLAPLDRPRWEPWLEWVRARHPERGEYLDLYDVGLESPEGHAVRLAGGAIQYAFFLRTEPLFAVLGPARSEDDLEVVQPAEPPGFDGPVELRGLEPSTTYRVTRAPEGTEIGRVTADAQGRAPLEVRFERGLVLAADPS